MIQFSIILCIPSQAGSSISWVSLLLSATPLCMGICLSPAAVCFLLITGLMEIILLLSIQLFLCFFHGVIALFWFIVQCKCSLQVFGMFKFVLGLKRIEIHNYQNEEEEMSGFWILYSCSTSFLICPINLGIKSVKLYPLPILSRDELLVRWKYLYFLNMRQDILTIT